MRKLLFVLIACFVAVSASAQKDSIKKSGKTKNKTEKNTGAVKKIDTPRDTVMDSRKKDRTRSVQPNNGTDPVRRGNTPPPPMNPPTPLPPTNPTGPTDPSSPDSPGRP